MEKKQLVSIIIPFYKGEKYIKNAIESVLKQTYTNFELLMIENGIKDNSETIIKKYKDSRIKYYYIEDGNVSNARNFGIDHSIGEYIYFMDGDDTITPNLLELCIDSIKKNDVDLVIFNYNKVSKYSIIEDCLPWKNEIFGKKRIKCELIPQMIYAEKNEQSIMGSVWRFFTYKRNLENLYFDNSIKICEDLLFSIRLYSRINYMYLLDSILYNYSLCASSSMNESRLDLIYQSIIYHQKLKKLLIDVDLFDKKIEERFYKNQGKMYTSAISSASRNKNKRLAKKSISEIISLYKKDEYNYLQLNFSISIKISFILMKFRMSWLLFYIYRFKEKRRIKNYNK